MRIVCKAPSDTLSVGTSSVSVRFGNAFTNTLPFEIVPTPLVNSITPSAFAPQSSAAVVTFSGVNFPGRSDISYGCRVNSTSITEVLGTPSHQEDSSTGAVSISCDISSLVQSVGTYSVNLIMDGAIVGIHSSIATARLVSPDGSTVYIAVRDVANVVSVTPSVGLSSGGLPVFVTVDQDINNLVGEDSVISCVFTAAKRKNQRNPATTLSDVVTLTVDGLMVDATTVVCMSPQWEGGNSVVDLSISTDMGLTAGKDSSFYYTEPVELEFLTPSSGAVSGGTLLRVNGKYFSLMFQYQCYFGATIVPATFVSSHELTCVSPVVSFTGSVCSLLLASWCFRFGQYLLLCPTPTTVSLI